MIGSDASVKFALSKDHDGYFKSAFAKDLISSQTNSMYNSSVSLLNSDDMDIVSDPEEIHVPFGIQSASNSFIWQKQLQSDCRSLLEDNRRSLGLARLPQGEELGGRLHTSILQSEVESLRWRLKESEESRMIYRRSVQELVRFLERAHSRMGSLAAHLAGDAAASNNGGDTSTGAAASTGANVAGLPDRRHSDVFTTRRPSETSDANTPSPSSSRDFTWRRPRRAVSVPRELDPARIADEALRLHRLATSLLQTGAPWLTDSASRHDPHDSLTDRPLSEEDRQLSANDERQLSAADDRRLPAICCGTSTPERRQSSSSSASSIGSSVTAHPTSHSSSMSSAFTRVGSLQKSRLSSSEDSNSTTSKDGDCRLVRASIHIPASKKDFVRRLSSGIPMIGSKLIRGDSQNCTTNNIVSNMEASSSSSSTENESGFSSMNSFHEIGLPLVNSTAVLNSSSLSSSSDESRTIVQRDETLKRKSINLDKRLSLDQRSLNQLEKNSSFLDRSFANDKSLDRRSCFERSSIVDRRSNTVDRRLSFDQYSSTSNGRESINDRRLSYFEKTSDSSNSSPEKKSIIDQKRSILDARWGSPSNNSVLYDKTHERVTLKSDDIRVLWV